MRTSNPWKKRGRFFQSLERTNREFPIPGRRYGCPAIANRKSQIENSSGSALIVALWVLIILSMLIGSFAFDMYVEGSITSHYRKRMKAEYLARAGVEWAKVALAKSADVKEDEEPEEGQENFINTALLLSKGMGVRGLRIELGEGAFVLDVVAEEGRRNVNSLSDEDWEELLDQANVPEEDWDELIDCFQDWVDADDAHLLNGAESDDPFYEERGYKCKNAALDTVDELLLIKGFTESVVYGGPSKDKGGEPMKGIAAWLTVWGDGKLNVNSANREVMLTLPEVDAWTVDDIIEGRKGTDGDEGTRDDGFKNVGEVEAAVGALPAGVKGKISTSGGKFVRVTSIGEVQGVRGGIWCVLRVEGAQCVPVFWREEQMP